MSFGDEIMAAGHAATESKRIKGKVAILGIDGNARWSDLWRGNPCIASPEEERNGDARGAVRNGPYCRPYIKYPFTLESGATYTKWRARDNRAKLYSTQVEADAIKEYQKLLGDYIVIEPNLDKKSNQNKKWARRNWIAAVSMLMGKFRLVQMGPAGTKILPGVIHIETCTFRHACLVLAGARLLIAPEGGLHHAAAALHKRAVVLFGGFVSPETTGYPEHRNLYSKYGSPCGRWKPCAHCKKAMSLILPSHVVTRAVEEYGKSFS